MGQLNTGGGLASLLRLAPAHGAGHGNYRPDVDGLRSIAVLGVVLYHFGIKGFGGGYVGVDIFFVISGFLIGRSIISDMHAGTYSLLGFYERRIRRLYPAFLFMMLVSIPVFHFLLLPTDMRSFGRSMVAAIAYVSNIAFYKERGYFDAEAVDKPLLHTWSLSVEEQFYVVFPLLIWAVVKLRASALPWVVGLVTLGSLAAAQIMLPRNETAVFFLFQYRAWELMMGVGLTMIVERKLPAGFDRLRLPLALAGLAMMILPIVLYTHDTPFPALAAVPPCLGAALLILSGSQGSNWVSRLLATPVPLFIGLISYSLYLWHWPIFVALSYYFAGDLPPLWAATGLLASLLLGAFSWRYIERLPRRRDFLSRWTIFGIAGACSLAIAALGFAYYRTDGMASRFPARHAAIVTASNDFIQNGGYCLDADNDRIPGLAHCRIGKTEAPPTFLVWADSHGRAYRDGIDALAKDLGKSGILVWAGGCPPLRDVGKSEVINTADDNAACRAQNDRLVKYLETDRTLKTVLFIGRWSYYTTGKGLGRDISNAVTLSGPDGKPVADLAAQQALFDRAFESTVDWLRGQGRRIFLMEQTPEIPNANARRVALKIVTRQIGTDEAIAQYMREPEAAVLARQARAEALFARLARAGKARIIATHGAFCANGTCSGWHGDAPALFDNNHVTVATSLRLKELFRPVLTD